MRKQLVVILIGLLFLLPFFSSHTEGATSTTGIIIPLYSQPGPAWSSVIKAKEANPSVPIIAIINPQNGPGRAWNQTYASSINSLVQAGLTVLGYVHTSWGERGQGAVKADINAYRNWYNISGIFFDEMSTVAGNENYYSSLNLYAKQLGYRMTVGSEGSNASSSYIGTMDILCIYENQGLPSAATLVNSTGIYNRQNFAEISYGVPNLNASFEPSLAKYVGWIYVTNDALPDPYDSLPSYFASEVAALSAPTTTETTETITAVVTNTVTTTSTISTTSTHAPAKGFIMSPNLLFAGTAPLATPLVPREAINVNMNPGILPLIMLIFVSLGMLMRKSPRWMGIYYNYATNYFFRYSKRLKQTLI